MMHIASQYSHQKAYQKAHPPPEEFPEALTFEIMAKRDCGPSEAGSVDVDIEDSETSAIARQVVYHHLEWRDPHSYSHKNTAEAEASSAASSDHLHVKDFNTAAVICLTAQEKTKMPGVDFFAVAFHGSQGC
jgi:hypothetical protein